MSKVGKDIPQDNPKEVIGGGLNGSVVKQLIAREKLLSQNKRSKDHLLFFNSNGAWARLVSSINTITEEETKALADGTVTIKEVTGNKNLAYNNVLMGGVFKQTTPKNQTSIGSGLNQELHNPINIDSKGFITAGDINKAAYNKYESLGFRPQPGITSVSVNSKGTYGTLREAEVQVTVWTLEDLEMMQALYLRPGYTILLEWGHSLQLDSETGTVNKEIDFYRKFLTQKLKKDVIQNDLKEIAFNSDYNYDSMSGYISNFNWSFRDDGGYDCVIKIISTGTVLESIAVTFDTSNVYPGKQLDSWKDDKGKKERRSIYHKLFVELEHLHGTPDSYSNFSTGITGASQLNAAAYEFITGDTEEAKALALEGLDNISKALYGDAEEEMRKALDIQTTTGRKLAADPTFKQKLDKLIKGDTVVYKGKDYSWGPDKEKTFITALEEEEVTQYMNEKFGMYGLEFKMNFAGDSMTVKVKGNDDIDDRYIDLDLDNEKNRQVYFWKLVDYMLENGKLPEDQ